MSIITAPPSRISFIFLGKNLWEVTSPADFWRTWNVGLHIICIDLYRFLRKRIKTPKLPGFYLITWFLFTGLWHDLLIWIIFHITKQNLNDPFIFTIFFGLQAMAVYLENKAKLKINIPSGIKTGLTFTWLTASYLLAQSIG